MHIREHVGACSCMWGNKACQLPVALGTQAAAEAFNDLLVALLTLPLVLALVAFPASFDTVVSLVEWGVGSVAAGTDDAVVEDDVTSSTPPLFTLFVAMMVSVDPPTAEVVSTVVVDSMFMLLFFLLMYVNVVPYCSCSPTVIVSI